MLTLGYPIYVDDTVTGAIIINAKISTLSRSDARITICRPVRAGYDADGGDALFAVSRRIVRPLREMNEIAGEIAHGRFDRKVDVHSRDEIGQLSESFNAMAEDLKKHEQLQSGFVANVSHELRSPMTSMQGFAQGMLDGTIPPQEQEKYLTIIRDESVRLTN
jgi:signal transduction histidine kinase